MLGALKARPQAPTVAGSLTELMSFRIHEDDMNHEDVDLAETKYQLLKL